MKSEANASSQAGLESPGRFDGGDGVRALSGVDGSGVGGAGAGASARGGIGARAFLRSRAASESKPSAASRRSLLDASARPQRLDGPQQRRLEFFRRRRLGLLGVVRRRAVS